MTCASCGAVNPPGQKFCGECGSPLGADDPARAPAVAVERRLVSVLFADLVGITRSRRSVTPRRCVTSCPGTSRWPRRRRALRRRHREVHRGRGHGGLGNAYGSRRRCRARGPSGARARFGGGLPRHGDGVPAGARAAVLTGEAAVALGARGQGMVAGDLVNTASRVQASAEPHTVLVGAATRRATEAAIAYTDAGEHELKGKAEPLPLWQAFRVTAGRAGGLKSTGPRAAVRRTGAGAPAPEGALPRERRGAQGASSLDHRHRRHRQVAARLGAQKYLDGISQDVSGTAAAVWPTATA